MKKIYFLILALMSLAVISCKNGAEDDKNESAKYPTTDTTRVEGKNSAEQPAPAQGDTAH